jgi:hypothetical protein
MNGSNKGISFAEIKLDDSHQDPIKFSSPEELKKILSETNEKIHTGVIEFICEEGIKPLEGIHSTLWSSLVFNQTHTDTIMSAFENVFLRGSNEDQSIEAVSNTEAVQ